MFFKSKRFCAEINLEQIKHIRKIYLIKYVKCATIEALFVEDQSEEKLAHKLFFLITSKICRKYAELQTFLQNEAN